jgi:MFS family permease
MTLITVIGSAYSIHLSPALAEKGLTLAGAATVAMVAGLTAVPGKLFAGSLFDRHGPSRMALLIMALLALACVLFALRSNSVALAITASAIFGLASGANMALVTVIVARYFDARVFGVVFGVVMSLTALAAAIGPLAISVIYDSAGSYAPAFWAGVPIALIAAVLMQRLRPVAAG